MHDGARVLRELADAYDALPYAKRKIFINELQRMADITVIKADILEKHNELRERDLPMKKWIVFFKAYAHANFRSSTVVEGYTIEDARRNFHHKFSGYIAEKIEPYIERTNHAQTQAVNGRS